MDNDATGGAGKAVDVTDSLEFIYLRILEIISQNSPKVPGESVIRVGALSSLMVLSRPESNESCQPGRYPDRR